MSPTEGADGVREFRLPYRSLYPAETPKPYLRLNLTGVNGASGEVWGIVDSGADRTSLPFDFAALLGYGAASMTRIEGVGAGGRIESSLADMPSSGHVAGWKDRPFARRPQFIEGCPVPLWGREDLFAEFVVLFDQRARSFTLFA